MNFFSCLYKLIARYSLLMTVVGLIARYSLLMTVVGLIARHSLLMTVVENREVSYFKKQPHDSINQ
jgi:hypothetical protein